MSVPLDRSGTVPGRVSLLVKRIRARAARRRHAAAAVRARGRAGPVGHGRVRRGRAERPLPRLLEARRDHLRPARHRPLRAPALPPPRAREPVRGRPGGGRVRSARSARGAPSTRPATPTTTSTRCGRRSAPSGSRSTGRPTAPRSALSYALRYPDRVERLVLDSVAPRRRPGPVLPRQHGRRAARAPLAVRAPVRVDARPGRRPEPPRAQDRRAGRVRCAGASWTRAAGAGPTGSRAWTCSRFCSPATSTRRCEPRSRARCEAALHGDVTPMLRLRRRRASRSTPSRRRRACSARRCTRPRPARRSRCPGRAPRRPTRPSGTAWPRPDAATIPDSAFAPFDRATALASDTLELCESWPAAPVAPDLGSGPLAGRARAAGGGRRRSPHAGRERAADRAGRSRARSSSSRPTPAIRRSAPTSTVARSARSRASSSAGRCRPAAGGRRTRFPAEPPPPRRLSAVRPLRGTPGDPRQDARGDEAHAPRRGRGLADRARLRPRRADRARGGGLRAGHYRIGSDVTLELHGVAFVPGVTVTGRIEQFLKRSPVRAPADRRARRPARRAQDPRASASPGASAGAACAPTSGHR